MTGMVVYANPGRQDAMPYVLDVQSGVLSALATRMVVPLRRCSGAQHHVLPRLMPRVRIEDQYYVLETAKMAAVPLRVLGAPLMVLEGIEQDVTTALDFLFHGF